VGLAVRVVDWSPDGKSMHYRQGDKNKDVGVRIASFRSSIAHAVFTPVYASLTPSRESAQDLGPSGSLVLSRKNFSFSASCRFIPALSAITIFCQQPQRHGHEPGDKLFRPRRPPASRVTT
jgi:hypothetical protein